MNFRSLAITAQARRRVSLLTSPTRAFTFNTFCVYRGVPFVALIHTLVVLEQRRVCVLLARGTRRFPCTGVARSFAVAALRPFTLICSFPASLPTALGIRVEQRMSRAARNAPKCISLLSLILTDTASQATPLTPFRVLRAIRSVSLCARVEAGLSSVNVESL